MPKCTDKGIVKFSKVGRREVQAAFDGGDITSDGGVVLLREVDRRLGLIASASRAFVDERRASSVQHSIRSMLAQRVFALACGNEDVSDHNDLRSDVVLQTAVGRDEALASAATLSRLETGASAQVAGKLNELLVDTFIASQEQAPLEVVLDIDATHVPLHGAQERAHFLYHYDSYCYLPLYVFAGQDMLGCWLRPSDRDPAKVLSAVIKLLAAKLRSAWPQVRLIVRADSGFCRPKALCRMERWGVHYIIGLAKNEALIKATALAQLALVEQHESEGSKQRWIGDLSYAAGSWDRERRVIARLEHDARGSNPRFVVTSLEGDPQALYEQLYCGRGEAENRIKEAQIDLFGRRASCHKYAANQLRLLLAALAYTLMIHLRRLALKGTELERACSDTIRIKLLKIGAAVVRNTRRVRLLLSSSHPMKHVFLIAARALAP